MVGVVATWTISLSQLANPGGDFLDNSSGYRRENACLKNIVCVLKRKREFLIYPSFISCTSCPMSSPHSPPNFDCAEDGHDFSPTETWGF